MNVNLAVVLVFALVYLGMALGRIPGLALDRTGASLLGAIAMVALGALSIDEAWLSVDMPTLYLLFALMVVSAQFRLAGFYSGVVRQVVALRIGEPVLLAVVMAVAGGLSAVLTNDVVCLAVTPMLVEGCVRRRLDPVPFLLGLACRPATRHGSGRGPRRTRSPSEPSQYLATAVRVAARAMASRTRPARTANTDSISLMLAASSSLADGGILNDPAADAPCSQDNVRVRSIAKGVQHGHSRALDVSGVASDERHSVG